MLIVENTRFLRGANRYSKHSVLVCKLRHERRLFRKSPTAFEQRVAERCGGILHAAGLTAIPVALENAKTAESALQAIAVALMSWVGATDMEFMGGLEAHAGEFAVLAEPEELAGSCALAAVEILNMVLSGKSGESAAHLADLLAGLDREAKKYLLPIQTGAIADACNRRGIGWRKINERPPVFQIGEGARQYRLDLSVSTGTSQLATSIARDKRWSNQILSQFGLPVSQQAVVRDANAAWRAARDIGLPVVVKPRHGNMGKGVSVRLMTEPEVRAAVKRAQPISKDVIVETYLPGDDHRILVAGGKIIAVARRMPAHVIGDGEHSIGELLNQANADPRRSKSYRTLLMTIEFDSESEQLLAARGYGLESIPPDGDIVLLKSAANWTAGGTTFDLTDTIHPENAAMAIRATELIGLDIAGVDLLIPDIARSFREVGGGICEVNYRPGILVHISADGSKGRDVAGGMIDAIYQDPQRGHIPTLVVCAPSDGGQLCGRIAAQLRQRYSARPAVRIGQQMQLDAWTLDHGPAFTYDAYELAIRDPAIDSVVFDVDPLEIPENGLGMSQADIVVVPQWEDLASPEFTRESAETIFRRAGARIVENADAAVCADILMEKYAGDPA